MTSEEAFKITSQFGLLNKEVLEKDLSKEEGDNLKENVHKK